MATSDLLHHLIEHASAWDVHALDDLVHLPTVARHPLAAKLSLTTALPRSPGVYHFVDRAGEVLYVGTATNLRSRVRSYFGSDDRRMVLPLLRSVQHIGHTPLPHPLLAQVLEVRDLHRLRPRYNQRGARPQAAAYVQLTAGEPFPRLKVVRRPGRTGVHLGPMSSSAGAMRVVEAIQHALPLRRCSTALRATTPLRESGCLPAQLGVAMCPCAGGVDAAAYAIAVDHAARALRGEVDLIVAALEHRVARLAAQHRYEEAALSRDRLAAYAAAIDRSTGIGELVRTQRFDLDLGEDLSITVDHGRIVLAPGRDWGADAPEIPVDSSAPSPSFADEAMVISRWLARRSSRAV